MKYKEGDRVVVTSNPGWSTRNRAGSAATIRVFKDERGEDYLAVEEDLTVGNDHVRAVSWPLDESGVSPLEEGSR